MPRAIFHKDFNFSSRISNAGWSKKAGPQQQMCTRELFDAAIKAGVATPAPEKPSKDNPAAGEKSADTSAD